MNTLEELVSQYEKGTGNKAREYALVYNSDIDDHVEIEAYDEAFVLWLIKQISSVSK